MFTNTKLLLSADAAWSVLLTVFLLPLVLLASFFGRPHLDATPHRSPFQHGFKFSNRFHGECLDGPSVFAWILLGTGERWFALL